MMKGLCKDCGCVLILDAMWERYGCPACRAARVVEAFRPIDSLRTAIAIKPRSYLEAYDDVEDEFKDEKIVGYGQTGKLTTGIDWTEEERRMRNTYLAGKLGAPESLDDKEFRIPRSEAAQQYELRRLFRL